MRNRYCRPLLLLMLIALAGCSLAVSEDGMGSESVGAGPVVLQSTPEEAVQSLLDAFNDGDVKTVELLIEPSDQSNQMILEGFKKGIESGLTMEITEIEVILAENTGEVARVQARFHQVIRISDDVIFDERSGGLHTLVKKGDNWYFIGLGDVPPPGWNHRIIPLL